MQCVCFGLVVDLLTGLHLFYLVVQKVPHRSEHTQTGWEKEGKEGGKGERKKRGGREGRREGGYVVVL